MIGPDAGIRGSSVTAGARIAVLRADSGPIECLVEELTEGDLVLTEAGQEATFQPLARITRRQIDLTGHPNPTLLTPVRIRAGALGFESPRHDLLLPHEALLLFPAPSVDETPFLVPVGALLNGASIVREPRPSSLIWYTLELETHGAVLVENVAVAVSRDSRRVAVADAGTESRHHTSLCARLLAPGPSLLALRARLNPELAAPEATIPMVPTAPPPSIADDLLHLYINDQEIRAEAGSPDWEFRFRLPSDTGRLRLASASYASPMPSDQRQLGVCVIALELDGTALPLDGPAPGPGFHPAEGAAPTPWRWTNGNAWLILPYDAAERMLTVRITDWHRMLKTPGI